MLYGQTEELSIGFQTQLAIIRQMQYQALFISPILQKKTVTLSA